MILWSNWWKSKPKSKLLKEINDFLIQMNNDVRIKFVGWMNYPERTSDALWSSSVNFKWDILLICIDQISPTVRICVINVVYVPRQRKWCWWRIVKISLTLRTFVSWTVVQLVGRRLAWGPTSYSLLQICLGAVWPGAESVIGSNRSRLMTSSFLVTTD